MITQVPGTRNGYSTYYYGRSVTIACVVEWMESVDRQHEMLQDLNGILQINGRFLSTNTAYSIQHTAYSELGVHHNDSAICKKHHPIRFCLNSCDDGETACVPLLSTPPVVHTWTHTLLQYRVNQVSTEWRDKTAVLTAFGVRQG